MKVKFNLVVETLYFRQICILSVFQTKMSCKTWHFLTKVGCSALETFMFIHYQGNLLIYLDRMHDVWAMSTVLTFKSSILGLVYPKLQRERLTEHKAPICSPLIANFFQFFKAAIDQTNNLIIYIFTLWRGHQCLVMLNTFMQH